MIEKVPIISLGGVSKSGKDTLFSLLCKRGLQCKRVSFGDFLKSEIDDLCKSKYGFSAFTSIPFEKELIRPLMVIHSRIQKTLYGDDYFVKGISGDLFNYQFGNYDYIVITDVRFQVECDFLKKNGATIIHLTKLINGAPLGPANEEENNNDWLVKRASEYNIEWPAVDDFKLLEPYVDGLMAFLDARRAKPSDCQVPHGDNPSQAKL